MPTFLIVWYGFFVGYGVVGYIFATMYAGILWRRYWEYDGQWTWMTERSFFLSVMLLWPLAAWLLWQYGRRVRRIKKQIREVIAEVEKLDPRPPELQAKIDELRAFLDENWLTVDLRDRT